MAAAAPLSPYLSPEVTVRIAGRLGMSFFLNVLRIACDGHDLLDGLLLLAIEQVNASRLDRPEHGGRYAGAGAVVPDELMQPITINALAESFGTPFETVRRRITRLRDEGACELWNQGLVIPASHRESPRHELNAFNIWGQTRTLYLGLRDLGLAPPPSGAPTEAPPIQAVARAATDYVLRQTEAMKAQINDPTIGVLLIHVIRATTEHLDDTYTEFTQSDDLVRDDLRRPASVALLAVRAGLPPETTRRHAAFLFERGWVARADNGGLYLTREMLRTTPWPEARRQNVLNFARLLSRLEAAHALGHWECSPSMNARSPRHDAHRHGGEPDA